jgi:hypothetical protein
MHFKELFVLALGTQAQLFQHSLTLQARRYAKCPISMRDVMVTKFIASALEPLLASGSVSLVSVYL